jgi:RNA polymerase sigma-70 factor, ECF subfamily
VTKVLADNQTGTISDSELVIQCQRGERAAFRQLYQRYQQRVRSTLYQLCGGELLDDLVQEVFLRVWKGLPSLQKPSYFSTWLYRISWNVATDRRRHLAKAKPEGELYDDTPEDDSSVGKMLSRPQDTPDLMKLHYQDIVQRALEILSLEHRVVLVLHDLEDLPQKEVAKILNLPLGTVKSRLFYARNEIKKYLQQQGAL